MNQNVAKALYVSGVTTFCTFLACWAVLAHQESFHNSRRTNAADDAFARKAAQGGMAEVRLGELAEEKASADAVKRFGKRMIEDHTKANNELKQAASKEGITLPADWDPKDQATYDSLAKLSGYAFDRAYAKDMVRDHQQDIMEFRKEANTGKRDTIKTFAAETLPTLQEHLKEARQIEQKISSSTVSNGRHASAPPSELRR